MTDTSKRSEDLAALFKAMLANAGAPSEHPAPVDLVQFTANLAARLRLDEPNSLPEIGASKRIAVLAAYLDGGLDEGESRQVEAVLAASPVEFQDAIACVAHLDEVASHRSSAPTDLVAAAIGSWKRGRSDAAPSADIVLLRARGFDPEPSARRQSDPIFDSFQLLAAASGTDHRAFLCRSQSGLWTIEVFIGKSEQDQRAEQGYLLLSVHPDHRATYEGRIARVFVTIGNEERVLAEKVVLDGEVYAAISLAGLDLWARDAINVVFASRQEAP